MRKGLAFFLAFALVFTLTPISGTSVAAAGDEGHYSLSEATAIFDKALSGDDMLRYDAFVYRGWRTNYGNWLNAVVDDLHDKFVAQGFSDVERTTAGNQGDSVWLQTNAGPVNAWNPQYLSLKVTGAAITNNEELIERINIKADAIDPTSMYYPADITAEYLYKATKAGEDDPTDTDFLRMQAVNKRVHLPTNATFTAFTDLAKTRDENIAAGTKTGQVVDVGTVDTEAWTNSKNIEPDDLAGKILLTTSGASAARAYATTVGAIAVLARVSDAPNYHMPEISPDNRWYETYVPFASAGRYAATGAVPLHCSLDQYDALQKLLAAAGNEPVLMDICALGTYEEKQEYNMLVVEIQGATKPEERIYVPSHINEPGACDNASGVATNFEIVTEMKKMIDSGELPRPARTITFVWGDEIDMTDQWEAKYRGEFLNVKGSIDLDMTGEDPTKTGGNMLIEKTPDPSDVADEAIVAADKIYRYGNFTFPGQNPITYDEFIRTPDKFSLWTGQTNYNNTPVHNYPGLFLNDLYLQAGLEMKNLNSSFNVSSNPYEGGSDHSPFVVDALGRIGTFIPALLTWHFTDYVYHSSCDTMDKLSVEELHDVGVVSAAVAYQMANAGELETMDTIEQVMKSWTTRMGDEKQNTTAHYAYHVDKGSDEAAVNTAYEMELKCIADWSRWYIEAVRSCAKFMVGGTLGTSYKYMMSAELRAKEDAAVRQIESETIAALNYVDQTFGKNSPERPKQISTAYVGEPVFVPVGTTVEDMMGRLPSRITVEYTGGGTGMANVAWIAKEIQPEFSADRAGLYRLTGTLSGLEPGVVNWAVVQASAEINADPNTTPGTGSGGGSGGGGSSATQPTPPATTPPATPPTDAGNTTTGSSPFNDVAESAWYYEAVVFVHQNGIMQGTGSGFDATSNLNRAMLVQMLYNLEGKPTGTSASFNDVSGSDWYAAAVGWASGNSIVSGMPGNMFAPGQSITREQMAVMLHNYCVYKEITLPTVNTGGSFADTGEISAWAADAVNAMYAAGVLNGKGDNMFDPKGTATRAEVAQMFMNFMEAME